MIREGKPLGKNQTLCHILPGTSSVHQTIFGVLPHPPTQASPLPKPDGPCLVLWRDAHFPLHVGEYCWCRGRTTRPVTLPLGPRNTSLTQADFPNFQEPTVL